MMNERMCRWGSTDETINFIVMSFLSSSSGRCMRPQQHTLAPLRSFFLRARISILCCVGLHSTWCTRSLIGLAFVEHFVVCDEHFSALPR